MVSARRVPLSARTSGLAFDMPYTELHCKTNFSFLIGASHADELVERARELGYAGLAVTDRNSLAGVVRAHVAAKQHEFQLIVGTEIVPRDAWPLVLWAPDRAAYGRLARLLTVGCRQAPKGECHLTREDILHASAGLLAGILPPADPRQNLLVDPRGLEDCQAYREAFGPRLYILAEFHRGPADRARARQLDILARRLDVPLVAAGDVHYHVPARLPLQEVMTAIREGTTVAELSESRFANAQRHLRPLDDLQTLYAPLPGSLERTAEVADRCHFSLDELRYEYPEELAPHGMTPMQYLRQLTWQGADHRYPQGVPERVRGQLNYELQLIAELHYEAYFLTVWDLVRFARHRGILCQGRGSAANSAVCYCLGVTAVDPERADLLFERFVSRERNEAPDIDVDFEHERREEVLQYVYGKYGRERAGLAAEAITYRSRSAIRDVGKALGLSFDRVDALAKQVEGYTREAQLDERCRQVGIDPRSSTGRRLVHLVNELIGFPRHLSQHVGGMVITQGPLCELVPIENAAMEDRTVISWDKNDLDDLGILKVDCLALGMLTAIRKVFQLVQRHDGPRLTLASIPEGDQDVYQMISRADTMGVFQIESRAQMSMLPRLRPRCYYDLVVEVAIVRPGPIQGQMVHPYLRRRRGLEPVSHPNEAIREVLHKTLGVPIFQEQAMRLAVVAAGFTPGQADQLRRAMGAWRRSGVIDQFRQKLTQGMLARGLTQEFADQVFRQIRGFGEYGFPESHAASFALLVYVSAWLKHYYPAAFAAALINSQPMGFYAPAQLIRDAQQHGVTVLPVDINHSEWDCRLELLPDAVDSASVDSAHRSLALRLGFRLIRGLAESDAQLIAQRRADQPYGSMQDFVQRTGLSRAVVVRLSQADAFAGFGRHRRQALWEALAQPPSGQQAREREQRPLFAQLPPEDDPPVSLPEPASIEQVFADYDTTGLSLKAHPLSFYRESLQRWGIRSANQLAECRHNQRVSVAGLVLLRQRPGTAKGITFVTLEDETGAINLVIHQRVWDKYYSIARRSPAWIAEGRLEMRQSIVHLIVRRLSDLGTRLRHLNHRSRDFR
jgi:error-prone DNA polymerase